MKYPERYRIKQGIMGSDFGEEGAFYIGNKGVYLFVIASQSMGWEHVSVSVSGINRCPYWHEMCLIKDLFFDPEDCVIQFHPPKSEYINNHPYCLHLWKKVGHVYDTPDKSLVGLDGFNFKI